MAASRRKRPALFAATMCAMKASCRLICATLAAALTTTAAHATNNGFNPDPAGAAWDRLDANTGFAIWDTFPNLASPLNNRIDFTNNAPDQAFGISSPLLSQPTVATNFTFGVGMFDVVQGTPATGANADVLFGGNSQVNFTLTGNVSFTIYGVVLQIKRAGSTGGFGAGYFDPRLTIAGAGITSIAADVVSTTSGTGDTSGDNGSYSVTSFYWNSSLAGNTGNSTFTITLDKAGFQRSLDGFALDVGNTVVVPEPATGVVLMGGVGLLLTLRRRTRRAI
jgi:hypothetical protein